MLARTIGTAESLLEDRKGISVAAEEQGISWVRQVYGYFRDGEPLPW